MKRTTKNLLIAVTAIVGIICIVNAVWLIVQSGSVAGWFTDYRNIVYGDGAAENGSKIVWRDNVLGWQYFIFYGRLLFGIAFDALLLLFMIKSILVLKSGAFFLKSNTYILISAAVCNLFYNLPQYATSSTISAMRIQVFWSIPRRTEISLTPCF